MSIGCKVEPHISKFQKFMRANKQELIYLLLRYPTRYAGYQRASKPVICLSVPRAHFKYKESVRNCAKDEGRPLGTGLQGLVSNRLKLRW